VDALKGTLEIKVATNDLMARSPAAAQPSQPGYGRELFGLMRRAAGPADAGACSLFEAA
jgi:phosphogluconate dehydratase